jgi:pyridoxamine 5'-phosphate oxidase
MLPETAQFESEDPLVWDAVVWRLLERSLTATRSPLRLPVIATAGAQGPSGRVVVLRSVEAASRMLTLFTDARSPKVAALLQDPRLAWTFWDAQLALQIRASSVASVHVGDARALLLAEQVPEHARSDYVSLMAPGSSKTTDARDLALFEQHFCAIDATVHSLDVLALRRDGHKRLHLDYAVDRHAWLVP